MIKHFFINTINTTYPLNYTSWVIRNIVVNNYSCPM